MINRRKAIQLSTVQCGWTRVSPSSVQEQTVATPLPPLPEYGNLLAAPDDLLESVFLLEKEEAEDE